ncbi:MAG: dipeptidyl-peptidase 4 [Frankiaceae bacterium]|jgi:dipeptidyl-peptidase-4|nr:dipeptidyl-peptidase 4 [Frankiaceae bacterium]
MTESNFARLYARTQRFTLGEPRAFTICAGGERVLFLRSVSGTDARTGVWRLDLADGVEHAVVDATEVGDDANLPAEERARRERVRETAGGVVSYSASEDGKRLVFSLAGRLHVADVDAGTWHEVAGSASAYDPRLDPTGRRVAYVSGRVMYLHDLDTGEQRVLAADDDPLVSWGRAEHVAAEEMDRSRGFWWAPDGRSLLACRVDETPVAQWWIADPAHPQRPPTVVRYPAAGEANADVTVHLLALNGAATEVRWDRERFPYVARVHWSAGRPPLLQVFARDQRAAQVLAVDVDEGSTRMLAEDRDPVWVEPFPGVPVWSGQQLVRVVDSADARALYVGDSAVTDPSLHVRSVVSADDSSVVFTASADDPAQVHVWRWSAADGVAPVTTAAGVHTAVAGAGTVVLGTADMTATGVRFAVRAGEREWPVQSLVEQPPVTPSVALLRLGTSQLPAGVLFPRTHVAGTKLPVLLAPYAGPHAQRVLASQRAWLEAQWLADQGFAVLVVDGRGTPGVGPAWERAIAGDLSVVLDDQVEALHAAARMHPDLDLERVGIRGWSFGGYLAALAVLRRPEIFHGAVAGAPVIDWSLYDTFYTERYLGTPAANAEAYARSSLLDEAASLRRPLLLIHGLADDNVVSAHTLLFSQRLTENGRPHTVLPLTGVTHMTPQEAVAENMLRLQVQFLQQALGIASGD